MEHEIIFSYFVPFFALFPPAPKQPKKIKILTKKKKKKKNPEDIIILYKYTINHDHMLYCSLDMACDR